MSAVAMIDPLTTSFFHDERHRLLKLLADLVKQNHSLGGSIAGFYHRGEIFSCHKPRTLRGVSLLPIHDQMKDDADHYMMLRSDVDTTERKMKQGLAVILSRCTHRQDVRDVLPEPLVRLVPEFVSMERMRPEGWILEDHPLLRDQFQKVIDATLYYEANRLLY